MTSWSEAERDAFWADQMERWLSSGGKDGSWPGIEGGCVSSSNETPLFTKDERKQFTEYCELLADLARLTLPSGFDGVVSRGGRCECTRPVPPGIPRQFERGIYEFCPACVCAKDSVGGIQQKLEGLVDAAAGPELLFMRRVSTAPAAVTNAELAASSEAARAHVHQIAAEIAADGGGPAAPSGPMPDGLQATINRLERRHAAATTPVERERIERMLEAARAAAGGTR